MQSVWDPTNATTSSSQTQPGSSQTTEHQGDRYFYSQPTQTYDRTEESTGTSSSQLLRQYPPPSHSNEPNTRSGFFAGSSHVDARDGVFTDVAGNLVINVEMKGNTSHQSCLNFVSHEADMSALNKLPRAKNAGYRSKHHRRCLSGTRKAELARIEKWESDHTDKRVYWLNGLAGSGKSTIAQTFAGWSSAEGQLGASFFCSRDFPDRRNIHLIFPTLAFGLAQRYTQFRDALVEVMNSNPDAADQSLAIQLEDLLIRPLKSTRLSTTIVIDALDECEDNEPASAILSLLAQHIDAIPSVKFFITGRPELPIRQGFRLPLLRPYTEVFMLHDVDPSSVDQDIELYLRTRLSEIVAERSNWNLTVPWPTDDHIASLVKRCSGLFIVASIIIRLIGDRHLEPREQLEVIIRAAHSTVHEGNSGADDMYRQVFFRSFAGVSARNTKFFDLLRLVVGSIVLAFNPLSCADLANILDIPKEKVRNTIRLLHSVLMVPDSDTEPLRICHKSFADFLTNSRRCVDRRFYIESSVLHTKLGIQCLRLMNGSLKKNICGFYPYAMNKNVDDLDTCRDKHIGGGLEHACRSWAKHLQFASRGGDDVERVVKLLDYFFKHHLLSWLEVLSIVGDMRRAVYSLRDVRGWFVAVGSPDMTLLDIMKDAERFILRFFDIIEASACHLYHSALSWSPKSSLVRRLYQDQISTEVKMVNAIDDSWDASLRTIQTRPENSVNYIAFSHKDDFIAVGEDSCVEVFETLTGHRRATFTMPGTAAYCRTLAFSHDDTLLVTGHGNLIISVWDLQSGGLVCSLEGHTKLVQSVVFSPCGTMIASCSRDNTIRIWNISSRDCQCVLEGHSDWVRSVCWSATRDVVISGSYDETVRVWDVVGRRCVTTLSGRVAVYSPDSLLIASGSEDEVKIFNVQTGDISRTISTDGSVESIQFRDQDTLMYTTYQSAFVIRDLTEKTNTPTPKSKEWLKRYFRKALIRFKFLRGRRHHRVETNPTKDVVFKYQGNTTAISSDGTRIASITGINVVTIWQTDTPSPNRDPSGHHDYLSSVAFSRDGKLIASVSLDETKLWDPSTGLCLHTFRHPTWVHLVIFSPDSTLLASKTIDRTIRIWDTRSHNLLSTVKIPLHSGTHFFRSLGLSADGNRLVSLELPYELRDGPSAYLKLWEVETGKCLASTEVDASFEKVEFGVEGSSVILESNDSMVRYGMSPNQSSSDDDNDEHNSLPMEFVPLHDTQQSVSSHHYYCFRQGTEWILDEQERRVLWVPPDLRHRSDSFGKKVVLGSPRGKITIVDFSGVWY